MKCKQGDIVKIKQDVFNEMTFDYGWTNSFLVESIDGTEARLIPHTPKQMAMLNFCDKMEDSLYVPHTFCLVRLAYLAEGACGDKDDPTTWPFTEFTLEECTDYGNLCQCIEKRKVQWEKKVNYHKELVKACRTCRNAKHGYESIACTFGGSFIDLDSDIGICDNWQLNHWDSPDNREDA
jgi:hypothetical protein